MRKTCSAVKFIVRYAQRYYTITYQRYRRQPKVAKTERGTGNNTCDQRYIYPYSAYTERRGSCKMASFSDVKLKAL